MEYEKKKIRRSLGPVHLPFIKLKVDNKQIFNRGFKKKKEEIDLQTYKLISCCENYKIKYTQRNEIKKENNLLLNYQPNTSRIIQRQLSNYCIRPKIKENITITNNKISIKKINYNDNIKRIVEKDYNFLKEKYNRYNTKLKEREINILNSSKNNNLKKCFSYNNTNNSNISNNDFLNKYNKYFSPKKIKVIKELKLNDLEEKKNDISDLFLTNIWNLSDIDDLKFHLKRKKEKISKIKLLLKDTNDKIDEINHKLRQFDKNSRVNSPKSIRNMNYIINKDKKENNHEINYNKIFNSDKKDNNVHYIKINLNNNKEINGNNYSFIKKSTADLIKYYQSLELMPDDYFYKERKRIIGQYPFLEKEANLNFKSQGNEKESNKVVNHNNIIKRNCKIMSNLADNNSILFYKVLKKEKKI